MSKLGIRDVLVQEARAIQGDDATHAIVEAAKITVVVGRDNAETGDPATVQATESDIVPRELYRALNALDRSALCLSGGGIRSAAFSLGVIQALAVHPRPQTVIGVLPDGVAPDPQNIVKEPADSLLAQFHYLSTVSGGGYIGSWLSNWRLRANFETIWRNLVQRPRGPDAEPATIGWIRSYSNYLTPKLGLLSGDTWAAIAIYLRNLILNWLIIIPVIASVLLLLKFFAVFAVAIVHRGDLQNTWAVMLAFATMFLIVSLRFATKNRPSRRQDQDVPKTGSEGITQQEFLWRNLIWAVSAAILITLCVISEIGQSYLALDFKPTGECAPETPFAAAIAIVTALGFAIYALSWVVARPSNRLFHDFIMWATSGAAFGGIVGLGAYLYTDCPCDGIPMPFNITPVTPFLAAMLFGVPWVLLAQYFAETIFIGLTSYQTGSAADQEWFGRAEGWLLVVALGWIVVTFFTFAGSWLVGNLTNAFGNWVVPLGGASGALTALLGKSSWTSRKRGEKGYGAFSLNAILAITAIVFAAVLIITISAALDWLTIGGSLVTALQDQKKPFRLGDEQWWRIVIGLISGFVISFAVGVAASWYVNINRFSLHAIYRNRLIRAFLGASNSERCPDAFSGFDSRDNPKMWSLWPVSEGKWPAPKGEKWRPFHVVNMALNIVSTRELAWQERKALSFTVSPLHSGSATVCAYRPTSEYGEGISLGTAMAISGAAASPNMGYHSSSAVTFLLAMLNVRLGWWLGNPVDDDTYRLDGPRFAIRPLLSETFGLTTETNPYIYLSDGGHFENLGLYEIVRRRCRRIVIVDAGCDPDYAFEDLGNAVRKVSLDLGVTIRFRGLTALRKRAKKDAISKFRVLTKNSRTLSRGDSEIDTSIDTFAAQKALPYYAIGRVEYAAADGGENGVILYIKAGYHGDILNAGVRSYATAHPDFPHQSTADQWFTESQFESYRALGFEITDGIFNSALDHLNHPPGVTLDAIFAKLPDLLPEVP